MKRTRAPLDLKKLKVQPLAQRRSLSPLAKIVVDPNQPPPPCSAETAVAIRACAEAIAAARQRDASVILMFGAHLVKNGAQDIVNTLIHRGLLTHLATNGAGAIHDWELAFLGRTEESVRANVATGTFGAWDETGRYLMLALLVGALRGEGYGQSLGRLIEESGLTLPDPKALERSLRDEPSHPLAPARAELLRTIVAHQLPAGQLVVKHHWKKHSILGNALRHGVSVSVHPGIGYDIVACHPMFRGAAVGRAAEFDFRFFGGAVEGLDGGVVLSVGSAVMAPQVFEKTLSCVNNLRVQAGREVVRDHAMFVVDIQDGGRWDWSQGEPAKDNPAYYLRFCKSFARMGGTMKYVQCDNVVFLHNLLHTLPA